MSEISTYGVTVFANPSPAQPENLNLRDADQWNEIFHTESRTAAGVRINTKSVLGYPPFWRGVNILSDDCAGLPFDVYRRNGDDREVDWEHPAQRLLNDDASPVMSAYKFRQTMESHALTYGNGYAYIERDMRTFDPLAFWILDPQQTVIRYVDGDLWYATTIDGRQHKYPAREIFHISGLTSNGIAGYSALDLFAEALGLPIAAQRFGGKFFEQGSNMSGILMVPHGFKEEKIRNTLAAWDQMATGISKAHKVALLQDGVKWQPTTITPNEGQFIETRESEVRMTAANILGLPAHLLGDNSKSSHNSLEQESMSYLDHSLDPRLRTWEAEASRKLLAAQQRFERTHFCEYNREAKVRMQFSQKIDGIFKEMSMGILTVNESRKLLNMPQIGDDGDQRFRPANWMKLDEETPEPIEMPPVDDDGETANEPTEADDTLEAFIRGAAQAAIDFECRKMVSIAANANQFLDRVAAFYEKWTQTAVSTIGNAKADQIRAKHAADSQRQIIEVAGSCSAANLQDNVRELVATWGNRAESLFKELRGTI